MAMSTESGAAGTVARGASTLIASDKVEGTPVRRPNGDALGTIDRLVIEKRSGRVLYAVMSVGGFLGMGEDHHAVPWDKLRYSEALDAYELDLSDDQLRDAPRRPRAGRDLSQDPSFDPDWQEHVSRYFNAEPHAGEPIESASHEAKGDRR